MRETDEVDNKVEEVEDEAGQGQQLLAGPVTEITQREKIEELLDSGYTPVQIEKEWGYPHSTVRQVARKKITPRGVTRDDNGEGGVPRLPTVLKAGKGQEVISPEAILQNYLLADGDTGESMLKGMMLLRDAQMMVLTDVEIMKGQADAQASAMKPVLDVMDQARKDMDAAAQRARESNVEIAAQAAYEAAMGVSNRVLPEVQGLKSAIGSQKGDPFARMMSVMQSAQTMMQMFGMPSGMMPMGQPVPGPVGPQLQQPWEPPPVERRRAEEWEE